MQDFYEKFDPFAVTEKERKAYEEFVATLSEENRELLELEKHIYLVQIDNPGGLVMPVILKLTFADGSSEVRRYPAEVFRFNPRQATKFLLEDKEITTIELDPLRETADVNVVNNYWPSRPIPKRLQLLSAPGKGPNAMQLQRQAEAEDEERNESSTEDSTAE